MLLRRQLPLLRKLLATEWGDGGSADLEPRSFERIYLLLWVTIIATSLNDIYELMQRIFDLLPAICLHFLVVVIGFTFFQFYTTSF